MIKYESNTQRERFIKQGGASLWWTYTLSSVLHSQPKGNISSFVGFERIDLEPLKVNFKNIGCMFSQAPNNPQNSVHFHSLKAGATVGNEWPLCSSWPTPSQAQFPGLELSPGFLYLREGCHPVPTAADAGFWVFHLDTCWKLAPPPPHWVRRSCGATTAAAAPTSSAQPHVGLKSEAEKKSMKIDFIREWWIYVFNLSLKWL